MSFLKKYRDCLILLLFFISCFGPFDPYNPPPVRSNEPPGSNPDDTLQPAPQVAGLIAYWKCNDTASTSLKDETGRHEGMLVGGTWVPSEVDGNALKLDGSGDYVAIATTADSLFNFGTGDFTVSLWVKPLIVEQVTDSSQYDILSKGEVFKQGFALSIYRNRFSAFVGQYTTGNIDTLASADDGEWHHLVMVRRSATVELYVDGNKSQSYTSNSNVINNNRLLIGRDASTRQDHHYSGSIDEIKILNKAWYENDVVNEYNRFSL
jgi:hypothetical protein